MLQDGDGEDAVVILSLRDFLEIRIDTTHPRAVGAIDPKLLKWFDRIANASAWKIRNVIKITSADFQETSTGDSFRNAPVHPGFQL